MQESASQYEPGAGGRSAVVSKLQPFGQGERLAQVDGPPLPVALLEVAGQPGQQPPQGQPRHPRP